MRAHHSALDALSEARKAIDKSTQKAPKKKDPPPAPPPSIPVGISRVEEDPRYVTLNLDLDHVILTGTNYGMVTLATTVAHSVEQLKAIKNGDWVKLPAPTTITAKDLHWGTGQCHFSKKTLEIERRTLLPGKRPQLLEPFSPTTVFAWRRMSQISWDGTPKPGPKASVCKNFTAKFGSTGTGDGPCDVETPGHQGEPALQTDDPHQGHRTRWH
ncbi:uncharacterized protein BYT42DRAFT_542955 [Radiomyces spectabilis]|uniref:uncharacterized protein n=1 Tax=Radiomyces spectabilis TaxID=64574 RepID=UPI00222038F0|nr:uncharacterized protein BYT42DRAFT_542955 [Radiomyces spectabilis]KAI8391399.1 hypothetical protein BYT42DRAFT_542955 [Radiomyces spectabilis]